MRPLQYYKKTAQKLYLIKLLFFFIAVFSLLLCIPSIEASETPSIQKIEIRGLYSMDGEEFLNLLDIKLGGILNPSNVSRGIKTAFLKGIFEDISVETDDIDKTHIRINVIEKDVIKKNYIIGNDYLSGRELRDNFLLKEDQIMRYDLLNSVVSELKDFLYKKGFHHADARIEVSRTGSPYRVNLILTVEEGEPAVIEKIRIHGPEEDVRQLMTVKEGSINDQFRLDKEVENIRAYYKKNNYLSPSVMLYPASESELEISVNPGRKIDIRFEGNIAIDSKTLLKEMSFFDAEDFRDDLIEESISRIISLYHTKGYPFVQVAPVTSVNEDTISIYFFIFEGDEIIVKTVRFTEVTINRRNLKEMMSIREGYVYNPDLIDSNKETLLEFYNALGYLNANIDDVKVEINNSRAEISITVSEGEQVKIEDIEIKGSLLVEREKIEKVIMVKKGDPYNEVDIADARYRIIDLYGDRGLIDAKVDIKQEITGRGVKVIFEIDEGLITLFGKTVISGNTRTKHEAIKRELLYEEGTPFNYTLLTKTRQKLYKLGLFTDLDIESPEKTGKVRDIHIRVKEGNAGMIELGVGYGDYEHYRGSFDVSYRNLFGMNRQPSFRAELSSIERRYILSYLEPWFLKSPVPFRALLIREERTEKSIETREIRYKLKRHTASAGIEKKLSNEFKGEVFYEFSLVKTEDVKPDVILTKEDTGTLLISSIKPGIVYDTRDNPFDPRRGVLAGISVKAASGFLLSETDFIKAIFTGSIYKAISRRFVVAVSLKSGIAQGFRDTRELPLVERFFLGGRTTVRGYEQDTLGPKGANGTPTGGNTFILANLELRTSLGRNFGFVTFLDGGNVWAKIDEIDIMEMKYTAGIGIRYDTPVGPLRIDYGHKLDRKTGESSGEVHFSIGHAF
ncbi:MAG: outer membrane protein assembly factor BamA [Nitrospirae bacterium]|nr:outer membrane protein assembly factor BamA [Nitrospirota bacterium]